MYPIPPHVLVICISLICGAVGSSVVRANDLNLSANIRVHTAMVAPIPVGGRGLAGVVVNASIVMLDTIPRRMDDERGTRPPLEILQEAVVSRLSPILVTTLTTLGGVLPTAYGIGGYDNIVSPMSAAIGWGLLFSTTITLFVVPVLFSIAQDINYRFHRGNPDDHIDRDELTNLAAPNQPTR